MLERLELLLEEERKLLEIEQFCTHPAQPWNLASPKEAMHGPYFP